MNKLGIDLSNEVNFHKCPKREVLEIGDIVRIVRIEQITPNAWMATLECGNKKVNVPLSAFHKFLTENKGEDLITSWFIVVSVTTYEKITEKPMKVYKFEKLNIGR